MRVQFLPALVAAVQRIEEGDRVGDVDQDRPVEFCGSGPDRIEPRIVHRDQFASLVAHPQSQRLPDFETLRAAGRLGTQSRRSPLAEAVAVVEPCGPIDAAEHLETFRRRLLETFEVRVEDLLAPAAVKVDHNRYAGRIQHIQQLRDRTLVPSAAEFAAQMLVDVNDRVVRPGDGCSSGYQCRDRI